MIGAQRMTRDYKIPTSPTRRALSLSRAEAEHVSSSAASSSSAPREIEPFFLRFTEQHNLRTIK